MEETKMTLTVKHYSELTPDELYELLKVRSAVFVVEQDCVYQDLDDKDKNAYHLWLHDEKGMAACLRVLAPGVSFDDCSIGRVLTTRRRQGLGTALMKEGIRIAEEKYQASHITIEAQVYAREFYEKLGFRKCSEEFLEDGIPHIRMRRSKI